MPETFGGRRWPITFISIQSRRIQTNGSSTKGKNREIAYPFPMQVQSMVRQIARVISKEQSKLAKRGRPQRDP